MSIKYKSRYNFSVSPCLKRSKGVDIFKLQLGKLSQSPTKESSITQQHSLTKFTNSISLFFSIVILPFKPSGVSVGHN